MICSRRFNQQGVALIVTLMLLLVISLLGVSALRLGMNDTKAATNSRITSMVFQAAEAGQREVLFEASLGSATPQNVLGEALNLLPRGQSYGGGNSTCPSLDVSCSAIRCITQVAGGAYVPRANCNPSDRMDQSGLLQAVVTVGAKPSTTARNTTALLLQNYVFEANSWGCLPSTGSTGTCIASYQTAGALYPSYQTTAAEYSQTTETLQVLGPALQQADTMN